MARFAFLLVLMGAACGSRSSLPVPHDEPPLGGDAGIAPYDDAAVVDSAVQDAKSEAGRDASARCTGRLQGWSEVDERLGGDFEVLVAAAPSEATGIWLAGGGRVGVQGLTHLLRVEVQDRSPLIAEDVPLESTEGWEPLALAVASTRVALVARGANGEPWLALFTHDGAAAARAQIDELLLDPGNLMEADVAWAGGDLVVAAVRLGHEDQFLVQRRDASLAVQWSAFPWKEPPTTPLSFRLRPDGSLLRTRSSLYDTAPSGVHLVASGLDAFALIGAAPAAWAGAESTAFVLERDDGSVALGKWPGSSWTSNGWIPVYASTTGVFITGNLDLAPVIGWFDATSVEWLAIPRMGGGGIAFADADNVGAFFIGLEIPKPDQPLRYWGCTR
jgi:hypothetical protein